MRNKRATPDLTVALVASRQHGVVSARQLLTAGLSRTGVARRVQAGRLHRIHHGIYAVGHLAVSQEGRWMAAILACGESPDADRGSHSQDILSYWGAALSHRSAAVLWQLLSPTDGPIHVSVPSDNGRTRRQGIRVHRRAGLAPASVTSRRGIPVTLPARTIADLRGSTPQREVRRAIRQAEALGLSTDAAHLTERTRSDLELHFLRLCRRHGVPPPDVNTRVDSIEVDFLWRAQRLVVETDGYRYHRGREAFENDHVRDLRLRELGYDVMHLSARQLQNDPERSMHLLREMLRAKGE